MQIATITIHNFRSMEDATLYLGNYGLMIGANNSGKTNVMDALRIFYEKGLKFERDRDFPNFQTSDGESWMDIEYVLSDDEYSNLKDEYRRPDNRLKVRKYLLTDQKGTDDKAKLGIYGYVDNNITDDHFYGAKNVQQGIASL